MSGIKHENIRNIAASHRCEHGEYEYFRRKFLSFGEAEHTLVSVYEIPPNKSAYPYHLHHKNEETFFILSGQGLLKTPEGERTVGAGDLVFFPTGEGGAHKLTNISDTETLIYLDFDVTHDLDVCEYPDSGKIAVWGKGINRVYPKDDNVDYYSGE